MVGPDLAETQACRTNEKEGWVMRNVFEVITRVKRAIGGLFLPLFGAVMFSLVAAAPSNAVVITFEGHENTIYDSPITRSGYVIGNPTGQEQHFHELNPITYGIPNNGTGDLTNDRNTQIFVQSESLSDFTLASVEVGSYGAVGLSIFGYNNGALTGTVTLDSLGSVLNVMNGSSLGNVDLLIFDGIGWSGGFALDNLTVNAYDAPQVPEPGTVMLFGAGMLGLVVFRKARKKG